MIDFALPSALEAHEPPARRDGVRLLVSAPGSVAHHAFDELPSLLRPGDLLVVNDSATLPAAVRIDRLAVHFSTPAPGTDGLWLVELRRRNGKASVPFPGGTPGEWFPMPGGATLTLVRRETPRLWQARLSVPVVPYLRAHGTAIRYGYVPRDWPISAYQTVFARPGAEEASAEMPSAARPFTEALVTRLVAAGILIAPITLHTGVASPEAHEPPYAERFSVPAATAALVGHVRSSGGRVIAVGTTAVRALETAVNDAGTVRAAAGWTSRVVRPEDGVKAVDGLLTGLHEPRSSHLMMLTAIAGEEVLTAAYEAALAERYLWHEFGDLNLILTRP
ncbi:S-adenosylmethionine:tRNA ribosyltransferase-isomerase [Actinocorallia longicatena]|uniref:S-adenosylmethionine:tRNA ribosyltransferase-isomerase n=1 Tax=Actinocorallia longicatena TaxID=111803 RepID=A0ABP6QAJ0_9ACTN